MARNFTLCNAENHENNDKVYNERQAHCIAKQTLIECHAKNDSSHLSHNCNFKKFKNILFLLIYIDTICPLGYHHNGTLI